MAKPKKFDLSTQEPQQAPASLTQALQQEQAQAAAAAYLDQDQRKKDSHQAHGIRKPLHEQRTFRVQLALTADERGKLDTLAKEDGRSINGYIANLISREYTRLIQGLHKGKGI